jgi:ABC-type nitrate/sulfonate/bicarbonate transport system ATPase subunit
VMSARPGRAVAQMAVALPRPRGRTDPEVVACRERVLTALGVPT